MEPRNDNPPNTPDTDALLAELRREVVRDQRRKKVSPRLTVLLLTVLVLWTLFFLDMLEKNPNIILYCKIFNVVIAFIGIVAVLFQGDWQRRIDRKCELLSRLREEPRAIGPMAMIVRYHLSPTPTDLAMRCLKTLLPGLQAEAMNDILPEEMDSLLHLLNSEDSALVVATLKGLEQIGNGRALSAVTKLAVQTQYLAVQAAAQECLPYLQARRLQEEKATTLLRPSQVDSAPALLLRPTASIQESAPEQLLRAKE